MKIAKIFLIATLLISSASLDAADIHDACKAGNLVKVQKIISTDPSQIQAKTPEGKSPLHMATGWGQKEIVSWLLQNGAKIDALNNNGGQPIHVAASRNQPDCAAILLEHGADLEAIRQLGGFTPLAIAVLKDNLEAAEFLLTRGANPKAIINGRAPLFRIAERKASERMKKLLQRFPD